MVWLHIAENEVIQVSAMPGFGNLPPFIRRKRVLSYRVLVHFKHVTDFEPENPTPPPSPVDSDDGRFDGTRDRGGAVHRIQGFPTARGVVDGEPLPINTSAANRGRAHQSQLIVNERTMADPVTTEAATIDSVARKEMGGEAECDLIASLTYRAHTAMEDQSLDPMFLKAAIDGQNGCAAETISPAQSQPSLLDTTGIAVQEAELAIQALGTECAAKAASQAMPKTSSPPAPSTALEQPGRTKELIPPAQELSSFNNTSENAVQEAEMVDQATVDVSTDGLATPAQAHPAQNINATPVSTVAPNTQATTVEPSEDLVTEVINAAVQESERGEGAARATVHTPPVSTPDMQAPSLSQLERTSASEATPSPQEAVRILQSFRDKVTIKRPLPILKEPPRNKDVPKKPPVPFRSRCIAAQKMDHVPASKRGEVLLMRRLGGLPANAQPTSASRRSFDKMFTNLTNTEQEAFNELFPATKKKGARVARRTQARMV